MGSSLDDTIYGAAKKAFDFGAKLHAQNKEKKELFEKGQNCLFQVLQDVSSHSFCKKGVSRRA